MGEGRGRRVSVGKLQPARRENWKGRSGRRSEGSSHTQPSRGGRFFFSFFLFYAYKFYQIRRKGGVSQSFSALPPSTMQLLYTQPEGGRNWGTNNNSNPAGKKREITRRSGGGDQLTGRPLETPGGASPPLVHGGMTEGREERGKEEATLKIPGGA